ncbi:MAG: class I SAM-dependent methyltransferase [Methyloligellaceae bacterium]
MTNGTTSSSTANGIAKADARRPAKRRGLAAKLRHGHAALLHRLHENLVDRRYRHLETVPTGGMVELDGFHIESENRAYVTHYSPTPRLLTRWVHEALPRDLSAWTFVDVGAGRGRVLLQTATHPYRRIVGIEFAEEFADAAERNIAGFPQDRIAAQAIEVRRTDALAFDPPEGPTVYFIFNPFGEPVMRRFVARIATAYAARPRPIICALVNPIQKSVFARHPDFEPIPLGAGLALKLALFSPYGIALYGTPEAFALLD